MFLKIKKILVKLLICSPSVYFWLWTAPASCYVSIQYIFTLPSCVWVCNGVEILTAPVSCYCVVSVSWCVVHGSDPLPDIPRRALHVAVGIVKKRN